jgi:hypothetical protein
MSASTQAAASHTSTYFCAVRFVMTSLMCLSHNSEFVWSAVSNLRKHNVTAHVHATRNRLRTRCLS